MNDQKNTRGWGWIVTTTLVVLVLYPLSIGPGFWFTMRISARPGPDREWPRTARNAIYYPVMRLAELAGGGPVLGGYVNWWFDVLQSKPAPRLPVKVAVPGGAQSLR